MTDLTTLDRPLGEYPDAVIGALVRAAWGNPDRVDVRITDGEWECNSGSRLYPDRIYRLAPEPLRPMSPPWEVLPEWVQSVTREGDGRVFGWANRGPNIFDGRWCGTGRVIGLTEFRFDRGNMPWDQSLVLRPEGV